MARMTPVRYREHLRHETTRLRAVLTDADPAARVPACPEWAADDLLWHHAVVLWFWSEVLRRRPDAPDAALEAARPQRPAARPELLTAYDAHATRLLGELEHLDGTEPAWSWSAEQTTGFTFRRQAHEAMVHRLDAERTVGAVTPLDPALAADGVAELVDVMYGGQPPPWGLVTPGPHVVRIELSDVTEEVWTRPGRFTGTDPDTGMAYDEPTLDRLAVDPGTPADAVVRGRAADVDAWMWNRRDELGLELVGDPDALTAVRAVITEPLD